MCFDKPQALDAAMKQFKSLAPNTAVLLLSEDADTHKIVCMAQVPQVLIINHHTLSTPPHANHYYHMMRVIVRIS